MERLKYISQNMLHGVNLFRYADSSRQDRKQGMVRRYNLIIYGKDKVITVSSVGYTL